ncbi:MAG: AI-2E family transporter [Gordonia sp. (in: high G+C Gram-positive bacteria)]
MSDEGRIGAGRLSLREEDDAKVSPLVRAAAAWSWRLLVIAAAVYVLGRLFMRFEDVFFPLALSLMFAALLTPAVNWAVKHRVPRLLAVLIAVVVSLVFALAAMSFVVEQIVAGAPDLSRQFTDTVNQTQAWLRDGPAHVDATQLKAVSDDLIHWAQHNEGRIASGALSTATYATKLATGGLLTVFLLIFFLYDGKKIWEYVTRVIPASTRPLVRGAGTAGFHTLEHYVRATVLVAFIDAAVIGVALVLLHVPMALPLTAIIFMGSFIPIVGSIASGSIAVVVALVTQGWITAVIVLAVLVFVMQFEGHVLQPFLLGHSVRLHPVAVILAIAIGLGLAGIVGGLLAVPVLAFFNTALNWRLPESVAVDDESPEDAPPSEQGRPSKTNDDPPAAAGPADALPN